MNPVLWCNRIIKISFFLLFILVPLILTPLNYELFEYNKMMVTYALTAIILTAWAVKSVAQRKLTIAKTPFDIPILLFGASQLVSALFSMDPHVSWFGYYSRFNGGMWSVLSYIALYFAFVSHFAKPKEEESGKKSTKPQGAFEIVEFNALPLFRVALAVAAVVSAYGVAERLGIDKHLWVQDVQNRVFSTLGQPNWLAAYLVALIPVSLLFAIHNRQDNKVNIASFGFWGWSGLSFLYFLVLLFTRSRSGLLAFAASQLIFVAILFVKSRTKQALRIPLLLVYGGMAVIVFVNGSNISQIDTYASLGGIANRIRPKVAQEQASPSAQPQAPLLDDGITESGVIRKYVWNAAINAWTATPKNMAIGTGTETFAFAFYQHKPVEHNLTSENDFLYNKAHNEYLNYLATTGAFGLGTYLLFITVVIVWFAKTYLLPKEETTKAAFIESTTAYAVFAGWTSLLITNFFGFSVVVVQILFFLLPAALVHTRIAVFRTFRLPIVGDNPKMGQIIVTILGGATVVLLCLTWYADKLYADSYRSSRAGSYAQGKLSAERAILLNPIEPMYRDELASTLAYLTVDAIQNGDATTAAELARKSIAQSDAAIAISPNNVNFWKTRTRLYYSFSSFDPHFLQTAISALETAWKLSPMDFKIVYNLAVLYGKDGKNDKAIELLKKSIDLKPNFRDAYFALSLFYRDMKQTNLAREILTLYLTKVNPNDTEFQQQIEQL